MNKHAVTLMVGLGTLNEHPAVRIQVNDTWVAIGPETAQAFHEMLGSAIATVRDARSAGLKSVLIEDVSGVP